MKSLIFTLCFAMVVTVSFGQLPASYLNKRPIPFVDVPSKPAVQGAQRGISTFEVSYHDMESNYSDLNGFDFGYFGWDLNKNFDVSCTPLDTLDDNTVSWAAVVFDSIYDYTNEIAYQKATFNSMTVDTIFWLYSHENLSNLNDTLIVSIYAVAPSASGLSFTNATQKVFSNTLLWSDTTITDSSLTPTAGTDLYFGFVPTGGVTIPAGQGFVVRLDYAGPKQDKFSLADGNRLECGSAGAASVSTVPGNTFRYYNGGIYTPTCTDLSGVGDLVFPSLPANCNQFYFQNWAISAVVTVDAPLAVAATADTTVGCPGQSVNLAANASGGSGTPSNYSYSWTGPGAITSPFSANTDVTLAPGNGIQTYTVTVIDGTDTLTSSVTVNVRGITVNLGNDTTIACGDSILGSAIVGGFPNGATFNWSTGAVTSTDSLANGTFSVTVTNNAGCSATDSKVVSLNVSQTVSFTSSTFYNGNEEDTLPLSQNRACLGETVLFTNTSSDLSNAWAFEWSYGDGNGSINTNGVRAYTAEGAYTVSLTASNSAGCVITSAPVTVNILAANHPLCIVGIAEIELLSNISLFPNPNTGTFTVDLSKVNADDATVMVVNMLGQVVYNSNTFSTAVAPVQTIAMENASNGIYFVRITANGVTATSKISVAK